MASSTAVSRAGARSGLSRERAMPCSRVELAPIAEGERLTLLDVLRGFALFGVLLANLEAVSGETMVLTAERAAALPTHALDVWAKGVLRFAVSVKFITLFTLLFGIGFAVQLERATAQGRSGLVLFRRRMATLLLFGIAHTVFLWWGDILHLYALVGLLLIPLHRLADRALRWLSALLAIVPYTAFYTVVWLQARLGLTMVDPGAATAKAQRFEARLSALTSGGSLADFWHQNLAAYADYYSPLRVAIMTCFVLASFLVGYLVGRHGILRHVADHRPSLVRTWRWLLPIALLGNATLAAVFHHRLVAPASPLTLPLQVLVWIGIPAMAGVYLLSVTLLFEHPAGVWRRRLTVLAPVGRMALSNYLLSSLAFLLLFDRLTLGPLTLGLGWLGKVGTSACFLLALIIFTLQLLLSHWWLARFRFGPAEWLWRSMTYGCWQPIARRVRE